MTTYDELIEGGEAAIESLIGRQETLQLEFKANAHQDPIFVEGSLTKSGKKILAKEASAFANSAGGVIVFGVDCRLVDKVDQAQKLTPISSLSRSETSVRDAAADLLQPRHDGIRVAAIKTSADPGSGFILVDVPRSERRPHRSEATDQKQYFKRSGSSSFPMEHYDIEDAFRRTSSPVVEVEVTFEPSTQIGLDEFHYIMKIGIKNTGEVTAKLINLQIWDRHGAAFGRDQYWQPLVKESTYGRKIHLAGPLDFAVHPGESRLFHQYTFVARTTIHGKVDCGGMDLTPGSIGFDYFLSAENMRMQFGNYATSAEVMTPFRPALQAAEQRKNKTIL